MSPDRSSSSSEIIDAMLLAARGASIAHEYRVVDLPRLAEYAVSDQAKARLSARFHLVDAHAGIAGRANAVLRLICQRCLSPVDVQVDDEFHLVLVASEAEMEELPDAQDSVIANASRFELAWLLEEQLLLAMPLVPAHQTLDECKRHVAAEAVLEIATSDPTGDVSEEVAVDGDAKEKQRPFADLRELLSKNAKGRANKS